MKPVGLVIIPLLGLLALGGNVEASKIIEGRYWYFIDNISIEKDKEAEILFWAALPMNHLGQESEILEIYPEPVEVIEDEFNGNRVVFWKINDIGDKKAIYFYYDFKVTASEVNTNIDPEKVKKYKKNKEYKRYTKSEPWIEISDDVKKKALEIIGKEKNPYKKAKLIYDWVLSNMTYEYPDITKRGVKNSFKSLKGDCGEFSVVFTALCRSIGIPARTVTCVWEKGAGHQWAEILIPPYGWIPVDTSIGQVLMPDQKVFPEEDAKKFIKEIGIPERNPDYLFGNLYPNRTIVAVGNNIEISSKKTGIKRTFKFLQPGGTAAYPAAVELKGFSKTTVHGGFFLYGNERSDLKIAKEKSIMVLAAVYLQTGDFKKAEVGLKKSLEKNPNNPQAWLQLGQVYLNTERVDDAIVAFKKCLDSPGGSTKPVIDVWAHNLLGLSYSLKGKKELADKEFQWVLDSGIDYNGSQKFAKENKEKLKNK